MKLFIVLSFLLLIPAGYPQFGFDPVRVKGIRKIGCFTMQLDKGGLHAYFPEEKSLWRSIRAGMDDGNVTLAKSISELTEADYTEGFKSGTHPIEKTDTVLAVNVQVMSNGDRTVSYCFRVSLREPCTTPRLPDVKSAYSTILEEQYVGFCGEKQLEDQLIKDAKRLGQYVAKDIRPKS